MNIDTKSSPQITLANVPSAGWSARKLRIGRIELEFVNIHDSAGAHHFETFLSSAISGTKRQRAGANATRYLEHLPLTVPGRLLSEEAADYMNDMERRELARTTRLSQKQYFRILMLATGDIPVGKITCDHMRDFWDVLRWWPKQAGTHHRFKGMTDSEILAIGKQENGPPPAPATMLLAQRLIAAFFNRLMKKRVIASSPLDGFGDVKKSLVQAETRRAFTEQEIRDIFSKETFGPWSARSPHAWWGPLIGLFTGARVSEVAQLKVADVYEEHGVWCFHFRVTPDANGQITQSLKGASSVRIVPVANQLLELGFADFIEDIRACGHPRLFPQLKRGVSKKTGKANGVAYGAALGQQFAQHLRKRHPSIEKGMAFHGFRHTISTALGLNRVPLDIIASITGHDENDVASRSSYPAPVQPSYPVLERHYLHLSSPQLRQDQLAALVGFKPAIAVPRYVRGQFAKALGPNGKKYP